MIAVNSGTMALQAAIFAIRPELRAGRNEIITTPYTFSATTAAIRLSGFTPVFADVHPETYTLDPASVKRVLTGRTAAILPVDLFGRLADYVGLVSLGTGAPIIQDACQAVGAFDEGLTKRMFAGHHGHVATFSFNGQKNVPAGEAGAMATNCDDCAERARHFISHGENFGTPYVGMNGRLNEITACVAWHGLSVVMAANQRRRLLARTLTTGLADAPMTCPDRHDGHAFYVYPFTLKAASGDDRRLFAERLRSAGIEISEGYITPPLHRYPALRRYARIRLPIVEALSSQSLCLLTQVRPPATVQDMRRLGRTIAAAAAYDGLLQHTSLADAPPEDF